jgi:hypothetical protein
MHGASAGILVIERLNLFLLHRNTLLCETSGKSASQQLVDVRVKGRQSKLAG